MMHVDHDVGTQGRSKSSSFFISCLK